MNTPEGWPIGVCGWSLQDDIAGISAAMTEIGLTHIHLAAGPAIGEGGDKYLAAVQAQGWTITSTMIGFPQEDYSSLVTIRETGGIAPDDAWEANCELYMKAVDVTARLGVPYLSTHAGFLDHADEAYARKFYDRIRIMADAVAEKGIMLLMETGQESAAELKDFLVELNHPALGINFDPANMILYDKDAPADAVRILAPWIRHIHVKDAVRSTTPGEWGAEVPWGDGQVGGKAFTAVLEEIGFRGAVAIEREAGDQRVADVRTAVERLTA